MDFTQYGFSEESSERVNEIFDFTTCERPDGSRYGTGGTCRKGRESKPKTAEDKGKGPVPPQDAIDSMVENLQGHDWNDDQKAVFSRMLQAEHTKELGQIGRKIENEYMADTIGKVSIGTIKAMKTQVKNWLEANMRTGVGAKKAKELEEMTPEERKRAAFRGRVEAGIKGGVVSGRMR
jgi:hypothetical protein